MVYLQLQDPSRVKVIVKTEIVRPSLGLPTLRAGPRLRNGSTGRSTKPFDEPFGSELTAEGLRVSSKIEKLEAERLR